MDELFAAGERVELSWRRPLLVAAFCALCYYSLEHTWRFAGQGNTTVDQEERLENVIDVTQVHTVSRDGSLALLALGGWWMASCGRGRSWTVHPLLAMLCCAVILWVLVGSAATEEKAAVFRRLVGSFGALSFAVGCARWLAPRDIVRMAWAAFGGFMCFSIVADFMTGGNPLQPSYRFAGTLHPNGQGIYCSIVCIASLCLARWEKHPWVFYFAGAVAFGLLVLTKSRGSLYALVGALLVMWIARREQLTRLQAWASMASFIGVLLLGYACIDTGTLRVSQEALLLGRTEEAGSLSGRVPLWDELLKIYAPSHFWAGYGFGGFWVEDRIQDIYQSQKWAMGNAHNLFLDLLLQIGVVGLVLVVTTIGCLFSAARVARVRSRDHGYLFYTGLFAFVVGNSLMEAIFLHPTKFATALAMTCAMSLTCFGPVCVEYRRHRRAAAGPMIPFPVPTSGSLQLE